MFYDNGKKQRVAAFIDGFNVYHFLDNSYFSKYKWLDYKKLASSYLPRKGELISVQYFTAQATWDQHKVRRHNIYIRALQHIGVEVVIGRFKKIRKKVIIRNDASHRKFKTTDGYINGTQFYGYTFEEKKTDVNIACEMVSKAACNEYDIALLISGDTDFEPVIETVQKVFNKEIYVVVPNRRISGSIQRLLPKGHCASIKEKHLIESILSDPLILKDGTSLKCPKEWRAINT